MLEYYGLLTSELVGIRWANRSFVGVFRHCIRCDGTQMLWTYNLVHAPP
jgi:hypothetical protein